MSKYLRNKFKRFRNFYNNNVNRIIKILTRIKIIFKEVEFK